MKLKNLKLNSLNTALIIIDVQNDFCSQDGNAAKRGKDLRAIQSMIYRLEDFYHELKSKHVQVIFTKYVTGEISPDNVKFFWREKTANFDPMCRLNTIGAELYIFKPDGTDAIIEKTYYDAFAGTDMKQILQSKNITNLIISGVRTEICVDATAKRAISEGFNVIMAEDLVATFGEKQEVHENTLTTFGSYWGFVMNSNDILMALE